MSPVIWLLSAALSFIASVLLCLALARPSDWRWLGAAFIYLLADVSATIFPPHVPGIYGNWSGKLASLALAVCVAAILRMSRAELPLGPPVGRSAWGWATFAIVVGTVASMVLNRALGEHESLRFDKFAFELTMPGLAEEMAYRGVAFVLLARAYGGMTKAGEVPAAACLTCVFALGHGVEFSNGALKMHWIPLAYGGGMSALLFLARLKSKSLPAVVVLHNLVNVVAVLINATP